MTLKTIQKNTPLQNGRKINIYADEADKNKGFITLTVTKINGKIIAQASNLSSSNENKGVASHLLRIAEKKARALGANRLELYSHPGKEILNRNGEKQPLERFYSKRGYKPHYSFNEKAQKHSYDDPYPRMSKNLQLQTESTLMTLNKHVRKQGAIRRVSLHAIDPVQKPINQLQGQAIITLYKRKDKKLRAVIEGLTTFGKENAGTGSLLLKRAEATSKKLNARIIELESGIKTIKDKNGKKQDLEEFYKKRGFKPYYKKPGKNAYLSSPSEKKWQRTCTTPFIRMAKLVKRKPSAR